MGDIYYALFCRIVNPNLIAYWTMDDDDANTTVIDSSGNGYGGIASMNTDALSAVGQVNDCFDFAGSDYFSVPDNDVFSFGNGSTDRPFSVAAWIYVPVSPSLNDMIVGKWWSGSMEWRVYLYNGQFRLFLYDKSVNKYAFSMTGSLSAGWHHVAATYDGRGGADAGEGIELYVDGGVPAQTKVTDAGYVAMESGASNLEIGAVSSDGADYYPDKIDELMIFNKALTAQEVQSLYSP